MQITKRHTSPLLEKYSIPSAESPAPPTFFSIFFQIEKRKIRTSIKVGNCVSFKLITCTQLACVHGIVVCSFVTTVQTHKLKA